MGERALCAVKGKHLRTYTHISANQTVKIWNLSEKQSMIVLYQNNLPFNPDKKQMAYYTGHTSLRER